ncbi:hypothetical protein PCIT_a1916 [Pseudoalteromonas citrea]|uniref:Uncharacterized protein n=1 Tax=Pseudoalteromonas citrea TaxID=43655 RepID=A0AAD4AJ70_9GAMM|nr:hypothetical protein PCIT_a1916 [Pseudoalteromonas citrea]
MLSLLSLNHRGVLRAIQSGYIVNLISHYKNGHKLFMAIFR